MEIGDSTVSLPLLVGGVVLALLVLGGMAAALVDLSRREVRHLPKWAWALVIVLVNFPVGVIIYLVVGRVPPGEVAYHDADADVAGATPAPAPRLAPSRPAPGSAPRAPDPREPREPIVTTRGLHKAYGDTAALREVDLAVPRGATYGLIGPNGAGKTTMLSILAGLRRPTAGSIDLAVPRESIGVLVDTPQFEPWLTAREVVDLARHLTAPALPPARVTGVLAETGLTDAVDRRVGGYSRGMLQRLGLAACLVGDPELLVLDEPFSALDPAGRREILELVGRLAHTKTVVLSTHILSDVQQVCDVVGVIDHGTLRFQGPLEELLGRTSTVYALQIRGRGEAVLDDLRARPWVVEARQQAPGRIRLVVSDAVRAEHEVPGLLAGRDARLVSFYPATDLETAFLELTS